MVLWPVVDLRTKSLSPLIKGEAAGESDDEVLRRLGLGSCLVCWLSEAELASPPSAARVALLRSAGCAVGPFRLDEAAKAREWLHAGALYALLTPDPATPPAELCAAVRQAAKDAALPAERLLVVLSPAAETTSEQLLLALESLAAKTGSGCRECERPHTVGAAAGVLLLLPDAAADAALLKRVSASLAATDRLLVVVSGASLSPSLARRAERARPRPRTLGTNLIKFDQCEPNWLGSPSSTPSTSASRPRHRSAPSRGGRSGWRRRRPRPHRCRRLVADSGPRSGIRVHASQPALERRRTRLYAAGCGCVRCFRPHPYSRGALSTLPQVAVFTPSRRRRLNAVFTSQRRLLAAGGGRCGGACGRRRADRRGTGAYQWREGERGSSTRGRSGSMRETFGVGTGAPTRRPHTLSRDALGQVHDTSTTCARHVRDTSATCPRHVPAMSTGAGRGGAVRPAGWLALNGGGGGRRYGCHRRLRRRRVQPP